MTATHSSARSVPATRGDLFVAVLVIAAVFVVHGRAVDFAFVDHGDPQVVTQNEHVLRGLVPKTLTHAFTSFERGLYRPLAVLAHAADVQFFGVRAGMHHAGNVLLHAINAVLVAWILARATQRRGLAAVVALLFALHPLQVQSVAWVSERGSLLAVSLGLLALERYGHAVRTRSKVAWILTHVFFAASLVAAPVLAPLPLALMAWDRWPLGRTATASKRWREKLGLVVLALSAAVLTLVGQVRASALATLDEVGLAARLANAAVAYGRTLRRLFWPDDLAVLHPFRFDVAWVEVAVSAIVLAVLLVVAMRMRMRWPFVWTGVLWWVVLQLPTVQLVQFGQESTADRFSYAPLLGPCIVGVFAFAAWRLSRVGMALAVVVLVVCGTASVRALAPWRDTIALFERTLEVTGGSAPVHLLLSDAHHARGDRSRSLAHANEALRFAPNSARVLFTLADRLRESGNYVAAYDRYAQGLLIAPDHVEAYVHIGELQLRRGNFEEAGRSYHRGLQVAPDDVRLLVGMAEVMRGLERPVDRLVLLQRALAADPTQAGLRREIAWAAMTDSIPGAPDAAAALRLAEVEWENSGRTDARALEAMAAALARSGRIDAAREHAMRAEALARGRGEIELADAIAARRALYLQ